MLYPAELRVRRGPCSGRALAASIGEIGWNDRDEQRHRRNAVVA